ncbi:MAG: serine/threonine protein kinase [Planctomycetes bacterium]|nr:serine/threonine protein kinase [Planctomycetota bacterium]
MVIGANQRVGEYVLVEKLGQGGFGEVWKARHHALDQTVAIKFSTDPGTVDELRTGGAIQHRLQHPAVVRTLGLNADADPPYVVMEYMEGGSLRSLLQTRGPLSLGDALCVGRQVLDALAHAHARGVVHRDIKPENVLLAKGAEGERRAAKLSDFGLGRSVDPSGILLSGRMAPEAERGVAGTLEYMAPEQRKGGPADAKSDLYSFGVVFYEMLTGERPLGAFRYPSEIFHDIPRRIDDFLHRCLAPAPADRYASSAEALDAMLAAGEPEFRTIDSGIAFQSGDALPLPSGGEVFTLRELAEALLARPEDARVLVRDAHLESWLRQIRERDLARRVAEIRASEPDAEVAVQKFLEATGLVPAPRMDLDAVDVDLGPVRRGSTRTLRIYATRVGRGILHGEARVDGAPAWVRPVDLFFKGTECPLEFTVSTDGLAAGGRYDFAVQVDSNGGKGRVHAGFTIAPRPALLTCLTGELELRCRPAGRGLVRIRNDGEEPLSLSASWGEEWLVVKEIRDVAPGEVREIVVEASPVEAEQVARLTLTSNGGSAEVVVRAVRDPGFWGRLFGR